MTDTSGAYGLSLPGRWRGRAVQALSQELEGQRERLILWMPVVLSLGIGLYFSLPFEPPAFIGMGLFLYSSQVYISCGNY